MTGTAEVIRVEDLEELMGSKRRCEVVKDPPRPGVQCKRDADVLIRYKCDCLNTGPGRQAWLCSPHYTLLRFGSPATVELKCSYCEVAITRWKEL